MFIIAQLTYISSTHKKK
ncbi:hypothetical protein [Paenibacillus sp. GP183]|nr:hypothetical protein [Paenibacillus sp. GP183]